MRIITACAAAFGFAISVALAPAALAEPSKTVVVQFDPGASGATLTGRLGSEQGVRYVLGARNKQFLTVSLRPDNALTYFIIYVPDGGILYESSQAGNEYYGQLYKNGDHVVEVFYKGDPGTYGNYDIVFEIGAGESGGAAAPTPPKKHHGKLTKDEKACLDAVAQGTGNSEVAVLSVETSEANNLVMVGVGPQRAPWKCLVKHGVVAEIMSMTDEGAL